MPLLSPDKYGVLLYGTLAERPAANTIGEKAIYVCVGDENEGIIYVKPYRDSDWIATQFPGMAPSPHGNLHHQPHFAEITHLHPLADITGTLAIGWLHVCDYPEEEVGAGLLHAETIPNMGIAGTAIQVFGATLGLYSPPTGGGIAISVTLNDSPLVTVNMSSGGKWATASIASPVVVTGTEVLKVYGPENNRGATGMDLKVLLRRVKA